MINLRNDGIPGLYAAMVRHERLLAAIWLLEREIKEYHSQVRDRNAVTLDQEDRLRALRAERGVELAELQPLRKRWSDALRARSLYWRSLANWINVKSLTDRLRRYETIKFPDTVAPYRAVDKTGLLGDLDPVLIAALGHLEMDYDIRQRRLTQEFQQRGLHSAIRGEIVAASRPKLTKTGEGMRYMYHRPPDIKPWRRITLAIPGGLTVGEARGGKLASLVLTEVSRTHPVGGDEAVVEVCQQIGTSGEPRLVRYRFKEDRSMPDEALIQRWSLIVAGRKRYVVPLLKNHGLSKPIGQGVLTYDLTWLRVPGGIQVCRFVGSHVNEALILPQWLLDRRMIVAREQKAVDALVNEHLRSLGESPDGQQLQGLAALQKLQPDGVLTARMTRRMDAAQRVQSRAIRGIEDIYRVVVRRVCAKHDRLVFDPIDLRKLKRYATRDLLRVDVIPKKSREYLQAVAPGKLQALLRGYRGLERIADVGDEVLASPTDLFSTWVREIGRKTGPKPGGTCHRSHMRVRAIAGE
jgi:hypothetical protein